MTETLQDLRFALRQLRRAPGFTLTAVLSLALGVGATTAMFSLLDQALFRALPVRAPRELVVLKGTGSVWEGHSSSYGGAGSEEASFSVPMYRDLRDRDPAFAGLVATAPVRLDFVHGEAARVLFGEIVSGNYFTTLGVRPALGRVFTQAEDEAPGAHPVAVLSFAFWRTGLHGDAGVVGSTITLNGQPFEVVGVAAPGFRSAIWGETPSLFLPLAMTEAVVAGSGRRLTDHKDRFLNVLGRLQPGETAATAQARSAPLWHALRAEELKALGTEPPHFVEEFVTRSRLVVEPATQGFSYSRGVYRPMLVAITGMASLVLVMAVVNVGSLLMVRAVQRVREFAMRRALGARAGRLWRQLLVEGAVLGSVGGALGLVLAPVLDRAFVRLLAGSDGDTPFSTALDGRLLLFALGLALVVSLLFSFAPTLWLRRTDIALTMRQGGSGSVGSGVWLRRAIVGTQLGLSLVLLMGAGLFVRTVQRLRAERVGFDTHGLMDFRVFPSLAGYDGDRAVALHHALVDSLAALPGVDRVAESSLSELQGHSSSGNVSFEHYRAGAGEDMDVAEANVGPGYFQTLGVPLLAGRDIDAHDDATHPHVAVVNEALARRYFGSAARALGQRMMSGASNHPVFDTEIVGVVANFRSTTVRRDDGPMWFRALDQSPANSSNSQLYVYLRTSAKPETLMGGVRQRVRDLDPLLAMDELETLQAQIGGFLKNERTIAVLAVSFGAVATVLAGVGLYGVLAFATAQRTREIGVRMALGASRWDVSRTVLLDVLKGLLCGVAVGLPAAVGMGRLLRSQLFGVSPADPVSLIVAAGALSAVAFAAAAIPARRAAGVEPTEALRAE